MNNITLITTHNITMNNASEHIQKQIKYMQSLPNLLAPEILGGDEKKFLLVFGARIIGRYDTKEDAEKAQRKEYASLSLVLIDGSQLCAMIND